MGFSIMSGIRYIHCIHSESFKYSHFSIRKKEGSCKHLMRGALLLHLDTCVWPCTLQSWQEWSLQWICKSNQEFKESPCVSGSTPALPAIGAFHLRWILAEVPPPFIFQTVISAELLTVCIKLSTNLGWRSSFCLLSCSFVDGLQFTCRN